MAGVFAGLAGRPAAPAVCCIKIDNALRLLFILLVSNYSADVRKKSLPVRVTRRSTQIRMAADPLTEGSHREHALRPGLILISQKGLASTRTVVGWGDNTWGQANAPLGKQCGGHIGRRIPLFGS